MIWRYYFYCKHIL